MRMAGKGRRQVLKGGEEYDLVFAKKWFCYLARSGAAKAIKRQLNRRARRDAKKELREDLNR